MCAQEAQSRHIEHIIPEITPSPLGNSADMGLWGSPLSYIWVRYVFALQAQARAHAAPMAMPAIALRGGGVLSQFM